MIDVLPDYLFHKDGFLHQLILPHNKFMFIPEDIFHQIPKITKIDCSYNPLEICDMKSIGEGFRRLSRLHFLSLAGLAGLGSPHVANCTLPATFLSPLSEVHK